MTRETPAQRDPLSQAADVNAAGALNADVARRLALELFIVGYEGTSLPAAYADWLEEGLGGVILFKRNLEFDAQGAIDTAALAAQTEAIFAASERCPWLPAPIFCAVDQEGGLVARLRKPFTEIIEGKRVFFAENA